MDLLTSGMPIIFSKFVKPGEAVVLNDPIFTGGHGPRIYMREFTFLQMRYAHSPVLSKRTLGHREAARNKRLQSRQATVVYTTQHGYLPRGTDDQPDRD